MSRGDASIDRACSALLRASGSLLSVPELLKEVEFATNALHLVPPHPSKQKAARLARPRFGKGSRGGTSPETRRRMRVEAAEAAYHAANPGAKMAGHSWQSKTRWSGAVSSFGDAYLSPAVEFSSSSRRIQATRGQGGVRDTWKGAIAGQIYRGIKARFEHLDGITVRLP